MQGAGHILDGVLLVGSVCLLALVELIQGHPKVAGDIHNGQLLVFHKLCVPVAGSQGLVVQAQIQDGHPVGIAGPHVDPLPLAAQLVFQRHRGAVGPEQRFAIRALGVAAQIGIRLEDAAGLAAVGVIGQVILLGCPSGGDHLSGPGQGTDALEAVPGGIFVVAHILSR